MESESHSLRAGRIVGGFLGMCAPQHETGLLARLNTVTVTVVIPRKAMLASEKHLVRGFVDR